MAKKRQASESSIAAADAGGASRSPIVNRAVTRSPGFVSIYANDIQVQTSPWDLRFVFAEMGDLVATEIVTVHVKEVAELRISPQMAKKLVVIMAEQLKQYEQRFGEIPEAVESVNSN
jgi:hypothetical protein